MLKVIDAEIPIVIFFFLGGGGVGTNVYYCLIAISIIDYDTEIYKFPTRIFIFVQCVR